MIPPASILVSLTLGLPTGTPPADGVTPHPMSAVTHKAETPPPTPSPTPAPNPAPKPDPCLGCGMG